MRGIACEHCIRSHAHTHSHQGLQAHDCTHLIPSAPRGVPTAAPPLATAGHTHARSSGPPLPGPFRSLPLSCPAAVPASNVFDLIPEAPEATSLLALLAGPPGAALPGLAGPRQAAALQRAVMDAAKHVEGRGAPPGPRPSARRRAGRVARRRRQLLRAAVAERPGAIALAWLGPSTRGPLSAPLTPLTLPQTAASAWPWRRSCRGRPRTWPRFWA